MNETRPPSSALSAVWDRIDRDFDAHIDTIRAYLRQPSVSGTGEGIRECARLTSELVEQAGGRADIVNTPGHPVVLGELPGEAPTLVRYGMYDVQPAEEPDWTVPPFAAEVRDLPGVGPSIVARGAVNSKGSLAAFLLAMQSLRAVAGMPVTVRMIVDGEEELGSPHLPEVMRTHRQRLDADAAFDLDLTAGQDGRPEVYLGCKGILSYFLTCSGGDWGGPVQRAAHSSGGVLVHSPAWSLVRALAALADDHERPLIPGLPDGGIPPGEEAFVDRLAEEFDLAALQSEIPAMALKSDDEREAVRALLYESVLNINGIETGYAAGGKTIVPHAARAVVDLRVAYGADMDAIDRSVRDLVAAAAPEVEVTEDERCPPSRTSTNSAVARAMIESHELAGNPASVWPNAPWWAPYYLFTDLLGLPFAVGGAGHGCGAHAADEYASIEGLRQHMRHCVAFLFRFAELNGAADVG